MGKAPALGSDDLIGGKYRLIEKLAEGGMGAVWRARHEALETDVAVKLMAAGVSGKELALARFEREAKASAKLKSHHIVRVHDYGLEGETPFMVMELLEGEDLRTRLHRDGPMSVEQLAPIFHQICKGLEVAHEAGFVHRDLKPSNVFLAREGKEEVVKVVDFGVARETKTQLVEDQTSSGTVVGSPHHMSPEQAHGERVDHRSDLWSLGVLVFRLLTGKKPFSGDQMTAILIAVVSHAVPKPSELRPELPADVDLFIERALTRNVERRFQSAGAMRRAFDALAAGNPIQPILDDEDADARGREDETVPSGSAVEVPAVERDEPAQDASREVSAVTAGLPSRTESGRARNAWLGGLFVAAGMGLGAWVFMETDAAPASAPSPAASAPAPAGSAASTAPAPPEIPTPVATSAPLPSASVPAPKTATPKRLPAPRLPPAKPKPTPKKPAVDPFTGLPIK